MMIASTWGTTNPLGELRTRWVPQEDVAIEAKDDAAVAALVQPGGAQLRRYKKVSFRFPEAQDECRTSRMRPCVKEGGRGQGDAFTSW